MEKECKVCGIGSIADAQAAINSGATMLGFLMEVENPVVPNLSKEEVQQIINSLPPTVTAVLVTSSADVNMINSLVQTCNFGAVETNGDEPFLTSLRKVLPVEIIIIKCSNADRVTVDSIIRFGRLECVDMLEVFGSKAKDYIGQVVAKCNKTVLVATGLKSQSA